MVTNDVMVIIHNIKMEGMKGFWWSISKTADVFFQKRAYPVCNKEV